MYILLNLSSVVTQIDSLKYNIRFYAPVFWINMTFYFVLFNLYFSSFSSLHHRLAWPHWLFHSVVFPLLFSQRFFLTHVFILNFISSRSATPSPSKTTGSRAGRDRFAGESYTVLGTSHYHTKPSRYYNHWEWLSYL